MEIVFTTRVFHKSRSTAFAWGSNHTAAPEFGAQANPMPPSEPAHSTNSGLAQWTALPALERLGDGGVESKWFSEDVKPYEPALRAYLLKRFPSLPDHGDVVQETDNRVLRARDNGRTTKGKTHVL